jgi:transmembrane sensor
LIIGFEILFPFSINRLQRKNNMMKENKAKIDKESFLRYLNESGSDEDRSIIQQWLDKTDTEDELSEESLRFWYGINPDLDIHGYKGDHILDKIHHNINIDEGIFLGKKKSNNSLLMYLTRIAAVLFIPSLVASLFFFFQNQSFKNDVSWAEIYAPYGTRTDFYLPDGSTGHLNGGSTLKFPTKFISNVRDVKLTGEAYFNVVSNHKKPFVVTTGIIEVKATGTSFNVLAYSDEKITEVTLKSGKIEVLKKRENILTSMGILKPGELFKYNSSTDSGKIQSTNTAEKLSWIEGKILFKYAPFEEVINKLNRWYNTNIIIKDESLRSYIYYGTFQSENLDEVLKLISYTAPIKYKEYKRERRQDGTFEKRKIEIYNRN